MSLVTIESISKLIVQVKDDVSSNIRESDLIYDLMLDSFDIMKLIIAIEKEYSIAIPPEKLIPENFKTVRSIMLVVKSCIQ